jgi:hypothetical protein
MSQDHRLGLTGQTLPDRRVVNAEVRTNPLLRTFDFTVHLVCGEISESCGKVSEERFKLQLLPHLEGALWLTTSCGGFVH